MRAGCDVVVVGGGIVGAAVLHALAARGVAATLVERGRCGLGTTAWSGGIVRTFHDDPTLVQRDVAGHDAFARLAAADDDVRFARTGFLHLAAPDRADHDRELVARVATGGNDGLEWLGPDDLAARFGTHLVGATAGAVWEPAAGHLDPVAATRAFVRAACAYGARVLEGVTVDGLLRDAAGAARGVTTSDGTVPARIVVLSAGAGTPALLDSWGLPHDLWAQVVQVERRQSARPVVDHPAFADAQYDTNGRLDPGTGAILLGHPTGRRTRADAGGVPPVPQQTARAVAAAARRFTWAATSTSLGSLSAAECFAPAATAPARPLPACDGLLLATGFGGNGVRMAPWAAAEIARLATSLL